VLYTVTVDEGIPKIQSSISVDTDLKICVCVDGLKLNCKDLAWVLNRYPVLEKWSQLENILSRYNELYSRARDASVETLILNACTLIEEAISAYEMHASESDHTSKKVPHITFLLEQLKLHLLAKESRKYSSCMLRFAYLIYAKSAACYCILRQSNFIIFPHINTLKRLSSALTIKPGVSDGRIQYLQVVAKTLSERERCVALLIDQIHINDIVSYKGGDLCGHADNDSSVLAGTVQCFMLTSILGNVKEVAALLPVKSADAAYLVDQLCKVIEIVQKSGFIICAIITDNNKINGKMYSLLEKKFPPPGQSRACQCCGGYSAIQNPDLLERLIYLLFDVVHLIKCFRNNWINQKNSIQGFIYPDFPERLPCQNVTSTSEQSVCISTTVSPAQRADDDVTGVSKITSDVGVVLESKSATANPHPMKEAMFSIVKQIYASEQNKIIKEAPSLSYKAVYPSSMERQNVSLALKVFDEKLIAVISARSKIPGNEKWAETSHLLQIVLRWWKMVNVRHFNCTTVPESVTSLVSHLVAPMILG